MSDADFLKRVIKTVVLIALIILACRFTKGVASLVVALSGGFFAMQGKVDKFLTCYLLLPFMIILNPLILGSSGSFLLLTRISIFVLMALAVFRGITGMKRRHYRLPVGLLFAYVGVACLSSATGWFPMISYMKIFNYIIFLFGLYCAANDMQSSDRALLHIRVIFMSFAVLVILGSLALLPFPAVAYLTSARRMINDGMDLSEISAQLSERSGMKLFAGITNHSQTLGPLSVGLTGWVICDMMFVVRRFSRLHVAVVVISPLVFYLTRSRTAMVSFAMVLFILFFYALGKVRMPLHVKARIRQMFMGFLVALICGAVIAELKSSTISRWMRKKDDVAGDTRALSEAMTSSRMAKVEILLDDFKRNPLMGMGFQVSEDLPYRYQIGRASLFSAAVEKGNVFLTVLSETGLVGAFVFFCFLCHFYGACIKNRYMTLLTLFTCFLASNMGEATFFSPTATGGIFWIIVVIGGLGVDLASKRRTEMEMMGRF